ncbi:tripartite tricarboxylate transporter TctB family protein [Ruegeria sp. 2012CJ41-6]|uniref:Tripartite tricarboxylate transporter TctB family protein n=1 Tax=Ruegeria spongiae TaxID=2942209 RepID=A0ABT0Q7R0_9RHOB|nr:tripartite tricarboxylate transporter TctB family protein [Ruegeria spongiae]MCL6285890.1 tripartite tricarboxylate transporter TctB family protein [Ruegeria spongiae]
MNRSQHIFGSGIVFAVGLWVTWISYTQQPAEAFLFPRLIASVFVVLAGWTFGKAVLGLSKVGIGVSRTMFVNLLPGLVVMLIYVFWAAKTMGFYTATAIAFFILLSLYDPAPHAEAKSWIKRAIITGVFVAVMYGLFALLLNVYTPKEILF